MGIHWDYLDSMVLRSWTEICREKRLLSEVTYPVGPNFKIIVGLSVARGMMPATKIVNSLLNLPEDQASITLADFDWFEFVEKLSVTVNENGGDDDGSVQKALSENFILSVITFLGEKTITLKTINRTLCFCLEDAKSIVNISQLIKIRLDLIRSLNFRTYYDDCLHYLNATHDVNTNLLTSIINMCSLNKSELSCNLLELAFTNLDKIVNDLDKICSS